MPWLFLFVALIGLLLTINSYRPIYAWSQGAALSFFAGWLTTELALHHIGWQLLARPPVLSEPPTRARA